MKLFYLNEKLGIEERYKELLKGFYKERFETKWERYQWYLKTGNLNVLVAEDEGKLIGQSCAVRCNLSICNSVYEIAWGVDSFVLAEYRGKGIGKTLQKKLHTDFEGFSSTSYSSANGHIKKKCGAHAITTARFYYYPVSSFFSLYLSLGCFKLLNKKLPILRIPRLYDPFFTKKAEITLLRKWDEEHIDFINKVLKSRYDLYVNRDIIYMNWKYEENPSVNYDILDVKFNGERVAMVGLSKPLKGHLAGLNLNVIKLFDFFVSETHGVTDKQVFAIVKKWIVNNYDGIDVIMGLNEIPGLKIKWHEREFLSNLMDAPDVKRPYLSAMDQDIEQ